MNFSNNCLVYFNGINIFVHQCLYNYLNMKSLIFIHGKINVLMLVIRKVDLNTFSLVDTKLEIIRHAF